MTHSRITEAEIEAAKNREDERGRIEPRADRVSYDSKNGLVMLTLRSGVVIGLPLASIDELSAATPKQLKTLRVSFEGEGITLDALDVDTSVPGLLRDLVGVGVAAAVLGAQGGRAKSRAKTLAVRENGKLGGRPRKKALA
jgi:hypothetical protein